MRTDLRLQVYKRVLSILWSIYYLQSTFEISIKSLLNKWQQLLLLQLSPGLQIPIQVSSAEWSAPQEVTGELEGLDTWSSCSHQQALAKPAARSAWASSQALPSTASLVIFTLFQLCLDWSHCNSFLSWVTNEVKGLEGWDTMVSSCDLTQQWHGWFTDTQVGGCVQFKALGSCFVVTVPPCTAERVQLHIAPLGQETELVMKLLEGRGDKRARRKG